MELIFLGTGAGLPSKERNVSSVALSMNVTKYGYLIVAKRLNIRFYTQPLNREKLIKYLLHIYMGIISLAYLAS